MNDTTDACADKAECGYGKTKALTADKTKIGFVNIAIIKCLTRSLTITER